MKIMSTSTALWFKNEQIYLKIDQSKTNKTEDTQSYNVHKKYQSSIYSEKTARGL